MQRASPLPAPIRWYFILAVIGLAAGSLSNLFLPLPGYPVAPTSIAIAVVLGSLLIIGVVRFHSNLARWIFALWVAAAITLTVAGVIFSPGLARLFGWGNILAIVVTSSANVAAVLCVFSSEGAHWFGSRQATTD